MFLAYVMYTSGSTGRPKGVMVEHRSICNQILWRRAAFAPTASDAVLQSTSPAFDPMVREIFGPLVSGARVVIAPSEIHDGKLLNEFIRQHAVTVMQAVPSLLHALLEQHAFENCGSLRTVFCGGEALDRMLEERFRLATSAELVNLYGCTETSYALLVQVSHGATSVRTN